MCVRVNLVLSYFSQKKKTYKVLLNCICPSNKPSVLLHLGYLHNNKSNILILHSLIIFKFLDSLLKAKFSTNLVLYYSTIRINKALSTFSIHFMWVHWSWHPTHISPYICSSINVSQLVCSETPKNLVQWSERYHCMAFVKRTCRSRYFSYV